MNQELLSLLTARVQRFHLAPGGIPRITAQDVAHALGMIHSEAARRYMRLKYAGESDQADELAHIIRRYIMDRKLENHWRIPRPGFLLDMSFLMLAEAVDPHICPWCQGRAEVRPETGPVIRCDACQGTGRRQIRPIDRARLLGISKSSWSDPWAERYREIQTETVDRWEELAISALRKRLQA